MSKKKLTQDEVICRFIIVHGLFYDYSKFVYINSRTKGIIICPIHGEFLQTPSNHLAGQKCPKCNDNILDNEKTDRILLDKNKPFIRLEDIKDYHSKSISPFLFVPSP